MHNVLRFFPVQGVLPCLFLGTLSALGRRLARFLPTHTFVVGWLCVCVCVLVHVLNSFYHDSMISPCTLFDERWVFGDGYFSWFTTCSVHCRFSLKQCGAPFGA